MKVPQNQQHQFALPQLDSDSSKLIDLSQATKIHESLLEEIEQTDEPEQVKLGMPLFEITTFRSDGAYTDNRRPDEVSWGKSLEEDLERRDFTINAMALSLDPDFLSKQNYVTIKPSLTIAPNKYTVHDPHLGLKHLGQDMITTVGDPNRRFAEDALRMLRAIRFSVQLNFQIDDKTFEAIITHADSLKNISQERISDELMKIMASDYPAEGIELLDESRLLQYILPELLECKGVEQGGHHTTDVWVHSIDALRECPSKDPVVRLATLLHDIGKPQTQGRNNGDITFYNHEIVGSRIASRIANRLRLSKKDRERIFTLVRHHMFHYQVHDTDAAIRRFMKKVGLSNIDDILDLREGDRLGSNARRTSWRLEEMKQRMIEQLHQPMEVKDLAINGNDLMNELGIKPGPQLGQILTSLFEEVLEDPDLNTKETLLEKAQKLKT
jgi:putative nucleotidyltransferase with HDIG domain